MPALPLAPAPAGVPRSSGLRSSATTHTLYPAAPLSSAAIATDGTFSGYASLFDVPDLGNDVIAPGAFAASLARRGVRGIRMLFQHRAGEPIGVWRSLREDARGLYAEGQLTLDNSKARDVLALLRSGAIDGLSIGFRSAQGARGSRNPKAGPRRLTEVDLWEISIVTFPMLPGARVTAVKTALPRSRSPTLDTPAARLKALTSAIRSNT